MRSALRELIGAELGVAPGSVPLAPPPGRPTLGTTTGGAALDLSCSASGTIGLVALGRGVRIGIDVERIGSGDLSAALDEGWLAPAEGDRIEALPADARPRALTRAWVQKEAVLKGTGVGLWGDLASLLTPPGEQGRVGPWFLSATDVPSDYVACIALAPRPRARRRRLWR